jgi:hypothetical protein
MLKTIPQPRKLLVLSWDLMAAGGEVDVSATLLIWLQTPYYLASMPMLSKNSWMTGYH